MKRIIPVFIATGKNFNMKKSKLKVEIIKFSCPILNREAISNLEIAVKFLDNSPVSVMCSEYLDCTNECKCIEGEKCIYSQWKQFDRSYLYKK